MEEQLQQVSQQTGVPTDLLARSAAARAATLGVATETLVAEWSGGEAVPAAAAPTPTAAPPPQPAVPPPPPPPPPEEDAAAEPAVEVLEPVAPLPERAAAEQEEPVPSAVLSGFPRWLAASFFLLPLFALLYALLTPTAPDCGAAGQLAIDPVTGVAENCDGTAYGVEAGNVLFSLGEEIYGSRCAACHGATGGGGVGPALSSGAVLVTFPTCAGHIDWVALGSTGWPDPTYGATNIPVGASGAVMPAFGEPVLSAQELAAVVVYERVQFGGEPAAEAEASCSLGGDLVVAAP